MPFAWITRLIPLLVVSLPGAGNAAVPCNLEVIGSFAAQHAIDGRTFRLTDGREVRLAGIEVPADGATDDGKEGSQARRALNRLLAGKSVVLKKAEMANDRYGRMVAHAFVIADGKESWLQRDMIAGGHGQAGINLGSQSCAAALLAAEREARQAKRGLWAQARHTPIAANDAAALLEQPGRFTTAEGKVLSVRESGGTIYVNFGRAWSRNLTVTILKRNERVFAAAGLEPKALQGRRVRVRGWVEDRNGPRIEAKRPEQIELLSQD